MAGVADFPAESREVDSAVALPRSELSLGICTFSCGLLCSCPLLVRAGGLSSGAAGIDCVRCGSATALGGAGGTGWLNDLPSVGSSWPASALTGISLRGDSTGGARGKWRARTDPRSSMGVNMLRDFEDDDSDLGCGGDWLLSIFIWLCCSEPASENGTGRLGCSGANVTVGFLGGSETNGAFCGMGGWGGWEKAMGGVWCASGSE